jgi:hypothetical protein
MRPLPLSEIELQDPFWREWQKVLINQGLPHMWAMLEESGRVENFERVVRGESDTHQGRIFDDSDVYKWMEGAAYALRKHPNAEVKKPFERMIKLVEKAQEDDGYLDTALQLNMPHYKFKMLSLLHEMYCAGHLIEAAVARFESTGEDDLLKPARRFAELIKAEFGPGKRPGYPGHEELELALVRLADATGDDSYREFARWLVDARGSRPSPFQQEHETLSEPREDSQHLTTLEQLFYKKGEYDGAYAQDDMPLRKQDTAVGHSVRGMYLFIGAADAFGDEDPEMVRALERIFTNLATHRMYITGGIGSSAANEGFTQDFDLPNIDAYAETCAAIGLFLWGIRMANVTGKARYADVAEKALYNGFLAGVSLDGTRYFYANPLESYGGVDRVPWFGCPCCPTNVARILPSVERWFFAADSDAVAIHIPVAARVPFGKGTLSIEGNYPWRSKVRLTVLGGSDQMLRLRRPQWAREASLHLNGKPLEAPVEGGYWVIRRSWQDGDVLEAEFPLRPTFTAADPRIPHNVGKTAVTRGPIVYCLEEPDLGQRVQSFRVDAAQTPQEVFESDDRMVVSLSVRGDLERLDWPHDNAYAPHVPGKLSNLPVRLIPYFAWNNRGSGSMTVWMNRK